jgi:oligopeptidase B
LDPQRPLLRRAPDVYYDVEHRDSQFIIRHNLPPAENYEVIQIGEDVLLTGNLSIADIKTVEHQTVIPHSSEDFIELHEAFKDHLVAWVRTAGLRELLVVDKHNYQRIPFADERDPESYSYSVFPGSIQDMESRLYRTFDSKCLSFTMSSFTRAWSMSYFSFKDRKLDLGTSRKAYAGHESRIWVPSTSSEHRIPISVLRPTANNNQTLPVFLKIYGAYGSFMDPAFTKEVLPLVNRGMAYAICHPRGDGDLGASWYKGGKYENKRNTFLDTQDCISGLVKAGIAKSGQVVLYARSAGGLVAGHSITHFNQHVAAIVSQVPFIDPVQDMSDPKVPWTAYEW